MDIYRPKRFKLYEIVDKATYDKCLSYQDSGWALFDPELLRFMDNLMDELEKEYKRKLTVICNNWYWNKHTEASDYFQWRGCRTKDYKDFNPNSMHAVVPSRKVRALDFDVLGLTPKEVQAFIVKNKDKDWCTVRRLEVGVNWNHVDMKHDVVMFKP